jgi:hypothetical protein
MINRSPNAFTDVVEAFDRALNAPRGIRIACGTYGQAIRLRQRFNYYRKLDRARNRDTYPPDNPLHGVSVYDSLELRIPPKADPNSNVLFIEPRLVENLIIEDIA